jgi:YegS/Rv2252/BmrU family lipid kinase
MQPSPDTEFVVIRNAGSGPEGRREDDAALDAALAAKGLRARIVMVEHGNQITAAVDEALAGGARLIVAAGGDGTVNAVASRLVDRDVVLGVLPMGTLNHFARDLGIPVELEAAVATLAAGHERRTDVGEVNDRIFLNNSSIGLYPRMVMEREHAQRSLGVGKWPALARATWHALRHPTSFSAAVCVDGETIERRTPFIFVGNNCYVLEGFGLGTRTCLDDGVLALYVLRPKSPMGLLWLGLRSLLGIGSHAGDFDAIQAGNFDIQGRHRDVEVATDGEVARMTAPIRYRIRPRALRVLAPAPEARP